MEKRSDISLLLVDNDADLLRGSARVLEQAGFAVQKASNGEEALEILRASHPNLVLLDRDMPGMDGLEACRRIKAAPEYADVLVVIMSGTNIESEQQAEGRGAAGADGFIARPIGNRELVARMDAFARIWRLGHDLNEKNAELQVLVGSMQRRRAAELNLLEDAVASRKRTEAALAALRNSSVQLNTVLDSTGDGILAVDAAGKVIHANRRFAELWRIPKPLLDRRDDAALLDFVLAQLNDPDAFLRKVRELYGSDADSIDTLTFKDGRIFDRVSSAMKLQGANVGRVWSFRDVTERRRAELALRENEEIFRHFLDNSPIYVFFKDHNIRSLMLSRNFEAMLGRPMDELLGKSMDELFPSELAKSMVADDKRVLREGKLVNIEEELNGRFYSTIKFPIVIDGTPRYLAGYTIDITERRAAEAKIHRLTQLYAALTQCNEAIVRCANEAELYSKICRTAVQFGGMKMAWIGFVDPARHTMRVASSFGEGAEEYLQEVKISADADTPLGQGPTGTAARENRPVWCQDFQNDPITAPWRDLGAALGFRASAALPLHRDGVVAGALTLYSGEVGAFDQAARELLLEMASDISFALGNFAREAARQKTQQELQAAEEQFRGLVEQAIAGIFILQDGLLAYANPRFAEIHGFDSVDEMIGRSRYLSIAEKDRDHVLQLHRQLLAGEMRNLSANAIALRKDGSEFEIGVSLARANYRGRPAIIGMAQDITEKRRAEEEIKRYVTELQTVFLSAVDVATNLAEMRDPYTAGHEKRVSEIAVAIGTELGLDTARQDGLRVAGRMHDIGQITIPAEVLSKPGKLSPIAYKMIMGHAQAGYEVLKNVKFPWPVAEVARQHHERIDGSGYPQGLKGEAILLEARIIAVADVVEAMSSHRPYRPALGIDKALEEIERGRGTLYDAAVADACLRLFREKGYSIPH